MSFVSCFIPASTYPPPPPPPPPNGSLHVHVYLLLFLTGHVQQGIKSDSDHVF